MSDSDLSPEFLEELRGDFAVEAAEHLQTVVTGLLDLEKDPESPAREAVYRAVHSMKGAAHAVQLPRVASLCQPLESVLSGMRKGLLHLNPSGFDLLHRTADALGELVAGRDDGTSPGLARELEGLCLGASPPRAPSQEETPPPALQEPEAPSPEAPSGDLRANRDTVRIETQKLDSLLLQAEELLSLKLSLAQRLGEVEEALSRCLPWRKGWEKTLHALKSSSGQEALRPLLEEHRARMEDLQDRLRRLRKEMRRDLLAADRSLSSLMESAKGVLMLPLGTILQGYPKVVRDLCRLLGKEAALTVSGEDTPMDKRILEGLKDPLLHLLRNGVDHGLEPPEERLRQGKPPAGNLSLRVHRQEGNRVEIVLSDDGRGIDPRALRQSAVKAGVLSSQDAEALDDAAALGLLFRSGVSTSPLVTDISGRGLGMAIVEEGVQKLGGSVTVRSVPGAGTTFLLSLPLTLATFRGLLVREGGRSFLVPTGSILRVLRIPRDQISSVGSRETFRMDGIPLGLARLGGVLGLPPGPETGPHLPVLVLTSGSSRLGFAVDQILEEQEALLKPLGPQLVRVRHLAGATVLGSGEVVPVLHAGDLIRSALEGEASVRAGSSREEDRRPSVLLVEDSITSRTLLRNILSAAGHEVTTAVDGEEGWNLVREGSFDLVVSDVEMPRMSGFDLTARIRSDPRLQELPVVLVTSLESREDRERGAEVGADAYIVKRGFDQGNLLDAVRRLL